MTVGSDRQGIVQIVDPQTDSCLTIYLVWKTQRSFFINSWHWDVLLFRVAVPPAHCPTLSSRSRSDVSTTRCLLCPKEKIGKDLFRFARMFDKDAVV